ncbi:MAG: hypothetical protein ABI443_13465 [Chthoniobacterales bacterium]
MNALPLRNRFIIFLLLIVCIGRVDAQRPPGPGNSPQPTPAPTTTLTPRIWQTTLSNGAVYNVRLDLVCSISLQKYISRTAAMEENGTLIPLVGSAFGSGSQKPHYLYADVTELAIETLGGNTARFYAVSPHVPTDGDTSVSLLGSDITDEIKQKTEQLQEVQKSILNVTTPGGQQPNQAGTVVKDYPYTTHAKNSEFKLATPADVQNLYQNAINAWNAYLPRH